MNAGTRNHLSSLCHNYVKRQHPGDYEILRKLAIENYGDNGPKYTVSSVMDQFRHERLSKEPTDVL